MNTSSNLGNFDGRDDQTKGAKPENGHQSSNGHSEQAVPAEGAILENGHQSSNGHGEPTPNINIEGSNDQAESANLKDEHQPSNGYSDEIARTDKNDQKITTNELWKNIKDNSPLALALALTPLIISITSLGIADKQYRERALTEYVEFIKNIFFDVYYSNGKDPRIPAESVSNFISSKTAGTLSILKKTNNQKELLDFLKQAKIGFLPGSMELVDPKSMDIPKDTIETVKTTYDCPLTYYSQTKTDNNSTKTEQPKINNSCLLTGINLAKINLDEQDLRFIVLKKARLQGTHLNGVLLNNANLMEADLSKAQLNNAFLNQANLASANLKGTKMSGTNLSNAILNNANFGVVGVDFQPDEQTDLRRVNLTQAKLIRAKLSHTDLRNTNLYMADLRGADLSYANLRGANLQMADLRGANLYMADLKGANLGAADLRKLNIATWNNYTINSKDLNNINELSNYKFGKIIQPKWFQELKLVTFNLKIVPFNTIDSLLYLEPEITNLSNADLSNADLRGTHLEEVNLSQSNLQGAKLYHKPQEHILQNFILRRFWNFISFNPYDSDLYNNKVKKLIKKNTVCQTVLPEGGIYKECKVEPSDEVR